MKSKWAKWAIAFFIALGFAAVFFIFRSENKQKMEQQFAEYIIKSGDIDLNILSTGIVQPQNKLEIKPPISGRAETILIEEGSVVKKNQIIAWMSSIDRAALIDAARAKGDKALKEWEEYYPPTPIMAPIDGTIIRKGVEVGQTFSYHDSIMTMSNRLTIKAQVDETDIARIKIGQKAMITLDAYPDSPFAGKVDKIAYDATTLNNVTTYVVDVIPETIPENMRSGMTTNVNFHILSKKNVLFLPSNAMKVHAGKYLVSLLIEGNQVDREIKVGDSDGKKVEILDGVKENDIALVPVFKLDEAELDKTENPLSQSKE